MKLSEIFSKIKHVKRINSIIKSPERCTKFNALFKFFKDKNVLEVGCNTGYFSMWISYYAKNVYGIDINSKCIKEANKLKKYTKKLSFDAISAFDLDIKYLKDRKIDAVFLYKVSGYWPKIKEIQFWELCINSGINLFILNSYNEKEYINNILQMDNYIIEHPCSLFTIIKRRFSSES